MTGVVVLNVEAMESTQIPWELMFALSDALLEAGDVSGIVAA